MFIGLPPSPEEACGCETMSEIASTCLASKTGYQQSCCEDSNPIIGTKTPDSLRDISI